MHQAPPTPRHSDVTPGHRRGRAGVIIAAVALVVGLTSCASGGGSAGGTAGTAAAADDNECDYGCLVPGGRVSAALSISATDTLAEINPRSTIPARVNNAINQHREQNGYVTASRCLRRFGGPQIYVVIFKRTCDQTMGPDNEPGAVVGFDANGQVIGQVSWTGPNTVGSLIPDRRR